MGWARWVPAFTSPSSHLGLRTTSGVPGSHSGPSCRPGNHRWPGAIHPAGRASGPGRRPAGVPGGTGVGEVAELAHLVADAIVKAHLKTMLRLDVEYDVLPRESEILHLKFWASAFELLKERKAIY